MNYNILHTWKVDYKEAVELQSELAERIELKPLKFSSIRYVAGGDLSFDLKSSWAAAGFVVWDLKKKEIIEKVSALAALDFPYIPGLLSFREIPPLLKAWKKLHTCPDAVLLDGHGIAHPRRLGLASHFGLWVDLPAVGCAKNNLTGNYTIPATQKGDTTPILENGEQIGTVLRTRTNVKPVFVSPGHLIDIHTSVGLVSELADRYKLPEPTRQAHQLVNKRRKLERKNRNKN